MPAGPDHRREAPRQHSGICQAVAEFSPFASRLPNIRCCRSLKRYGGHPDRLRQVSPMNTSSWPKAGPCTGHPGPAPHWLKLGCSWPSLHSYIGRTAPSTDRKSQAENEDPGTSPDERKPGSRRRQGAGETGVPPSPRAIPRRRRVPPGSSCGLDSAARFARSPGHEANHPRHPQGAVRWRRVAL